MYPIVVPLLFGGMVWSCKQMKRTIIQLLKTKVIVPEHGKTRTSFLSFVSGRLADQARNLLLFSLIVTVIIMAVDTWDVWAGYYNGNFQRGPDWETAFLHWPDKFRFHDAYVKQQDLAFTIAAYSLQAVVSLISLYWIGTYWQFLMCLEGIIRGKDHEYKFSPLIHDPYRRFGLYPLASLFNSLLVLTVIFQLYAFYHRLQQHEHYRQNESGIEYLAKLFKEDTKERNTQTKEIAAKEPQEKKELKISLNGMLNLVKQDYSLDTLSHTSTMLPLILITIPLVVVTFLPLGGIRSAVKRYRDNEYVRNSRALDDAIDAGESKKGEAEVYRRRRAALDKANIWPNGDPTAWGFLSAIGVLSIGSWLPPFLVYLVACGGLLWAWKLFQRLRSGKTEDD